LDVGVLLQSILQPKGLSRRVLANEVEETGILIKGRLELSVGNQTYILESGDSYHFSYSGNGVDSTSPSRFS
jgi:hypothetical protein